MLFCVSVSSAKSGCIIFLIAIERYIAIIHPLRYSTLVTKGILQLGILISAILLAPNLTVSLFGFKRVHTACACTLDEIVQPKILLLMLRLPYGKHTDGRNNHVCQNILHCLEATKAN